MDGAAAGHDAGHALGGVGDEAQKHASVDGEVVHTLLGLLEQGLAEELPRDLLRLATGLLERLVDGHRADGDGCVAHDPLARLVDLPARGQVHERVGAPHGGPLQLLDLLLDRACHRRVPDVGVDLDLEVAANYHGLQLKVPLVAGDDSPAPCDLAAHELRVHLLPGRHEGHFLRHDALLRVMHLGEAFVAPGLALADPIGAHVTEADQRIHILRTRRVVQVQVRTTGAL
mmetsp:Transcript_918/g.2122  ORF Transcript_918/g.2122 Transcript_918/m.2122 type:complete len:230 (-) Transcript_918:274-963(-)